MLPFTEYVFCPLVLEARWFFFPSYLSWEVETWLHFTDEESEAESNVMEAISKHRPISAGETLLWCCCGFLLLHDKLPSPRGLRTT